MRTRQQATHETLETHLYGSPWQMWLGEFVTNSGLFWIFNSLRLLSVNGWSAWLHEWPNWVLLVASVIQSYVLSRHLRRYRWLGNFIVPVLYTLVEVPIEGPHFFHEAYHWIVWVYSAWMAFTYAVRGMCPLGVVLAQSIGRTSLLPIMYMVSEEYVWANGRMSLYTYWFKDQGHLFILVSALFFGVLLGISDALRERFERLLRDVVTYLERLTNWVYDPRLVAASFDDTSRLELHRTQRSILFMDIRGFTAWSEAHDASDVVAMLNAYYSLAEQVIDAHGGFKMQLIGDEVLTRFERAEDAVRTALALQERVGALLQLYDLSVGVGVHTGDVIEGLIGTPRTRQYGIIGDAVNTAARLQSAAAGGEVLVSEQTFHLLPADLQQWRQDERAVLAKGKAEPVRAYVLAASLLSTSHLIA